MMQHAPEKEKNNPVTIAQVKCITGKMVDNIEDKDLAEFDSYMDKKIAGDKEAKIPDFTKDAMMKADADCKAEVTGENSGK